MASPGVLNICHKQDIISSSTPHQPLLEKVTLSIPIMVWEKVPSQTKKRNHFKEIRDRVSGNIETENVYTKFVVCAKEDILTSHEPFTREGGPTYPTFWFESGYQQN